MRSSTEPIKWHEQCLINTRHSLANAECDAARTLATRDRLQADVTFYERQIAEAKKRGMKSFDRDRLLKNKR